MPKLIRQQSGLVVNKGQEQEKTGNFARTKRLKQQHWQ
jgi:hypothetical protein